MPSVKHSNVESGAAPMPLIRINPFGSSHLAWHYPRHVLLLRMRMGNHAAGGLPAHVPLRELKSSNHERGVCSTLTVTA